MKKILFICVLISLFTISASCVNEPTVSAESAVVINALTNEVVYEKNAYQKRSMASTTKIMTSLIAVESGMLDCTVTANNFAAEGTSIGLKDGYILTLESLVYGMLLESGNDAAKLTANFLAGSEENFSVLMNSKAKEIGMLSTNFVTASGLDDEEHYTTAYDMALLGAYAVSNNVFKDICSTKSVTVDYINPQISSTFTNHNRLLDSCEGVFGVKTGFTKKSGRCLVTACERNNVIFVAVTLNAPDDWNDHTKLYDYCYSTCETTRIDIEAPVSVQIFGGKTNILKIKTQADSYTYTYNRNGKILTQKIVLPNFVYAPIKKGDCVGEVQIYSEGYLLDCVPILADESVDSIEEIIKISFKEKVYNLFNKFIS